MGLVPQTRIEYFLDGIVYGHDVLKPESRIERFLYAIKNGTVCTLTPKHRIEMFLAKISGVDIAMPVPQTRTELFLNAIALGGGEVPEPFARVEYWLYEWAQQGGGEIVTVTGISPLLLANALAHSILSLTQEGKVEQPSVDYLATVTQAGAVEQRNVPQGHTQLSYIQSDGNQIIDTGYLLRDTDRVEMDYTLITPAANGDKFLLGARNPSDSSVGGVWISSWVNNALEYANWYIRFGSSTSATITVITSSQQQGTLSISKGQFVVNGTTVATPNYVSMPIYPLTLFNRYAADGTLEGKGAVMQMSETRIFDGDNNLIHRYVADRRDSDNALGVYDLADDVFIGNSGTGSFTGGAAVTPTPDHPMDLWCNNGRLVYTPPVSFPSLPYVASSASYAQKSAAALSAFNGDCLAITTDNRAPAYYFATYDEDIEAYVLYAVSTVGSYVGAFVQVDNYEGGYFSYPAIGGGSMTVDGAVWYYSKLFDEGFDDDPSLPHYADIETACRAFASAGGGGLTIVGTPSTITDADGNVATLASLLAVGDYKDTQEIINGILTHKIGVKVFDGTENILTGQNGWITENVQDQFWDNATPYSPLCTHFVGVPNTPEKNSNTVRVYRTSDNIGRIYFGVDKTIEEFSTLTKFAAWLAAQYNAGTPVIVLYPLATPTTESAAGQMLVNAPLTVSAEVTMPAPTTTTAPVSTPDPKRPLPLWCNNGELKLSPNKADVSKIAGTGISVSGETITIEPSSSAGVQTSVPLSTVCPALVAGETYFLSFEHGENVADHIWLRGGGSGGKWLNNTTMTLSANDLSGLFKFYNAASPYGEGTITKFSITKGSSAQAYHPYGEVYADGTPETLTVRGKNLFDKAAVDANWKVGYIIDDSGNEVPDGISCYSTYAIPIKPNTKYIASWLGSSSALQRFYWYTADGTFISRSNAPSSARTSPANAAYMRVQRQNGDYLVATDVQIEEGNTATDYEPYTPQTVTNIPNKLAVGTYKDTYEFISGLLTHKVGVLVFDGTENWSYGEVGGVYYFALRIEDLTTVAYYPAISTHFGSDTSGATDNFLYTGSSTRYLRVKCSSCADVTAFKALLAAQYAAGTPVIVIYPLATETTEQTTAHNLVTNEGDNTVTVVAEVDSIALSVEYKKHR